jgi:protein TonB
LPPATVPQRQIKKPQPENPGRSSNDFAKKNKPNTEAAVKARQASPAPLGKQQEQLEVRATKKQQYLADLMQRIHRRKFYPRAARQQRKSGRVVVGFEVLRKGEIKNIRVLEPSGSPLLDEAALNTVRDISPAAPLPAELGLARLNLAVPIVFGFKR